MGRWCTCCCRRCRASGEVCWSTASCCSSCILCPSSSSAATCISHQVAGLCLTFCCKVCTAHCFRVMRNTTEPTGQCSLQSDKHTYVNTTVTFSSSSSTTACSSSLSLVTPSSSASASASCSISHAFNTTLNSYSALAWAHDLLLFDRLTTGQTQWPWTRVATQCPQAFSKCLSAAACVLQECNTSKHIHQCFQLMMIWVHANGPSSFLDRSCLSQC